MKRIIFITLAILLTACLSSSEGAAPQTVEPIPTVTALPTATATVFPPPTPSPVPTEVPISLDDVSKLSDEDILKAYLPDTGMEGDNKVSIMKNIIINVDSTGKIRLYDITKGDFVNEMEAGVAVIENRKGGYVQMKIISGSSNESVSSQEICDSAIKYMVQNGANGPLGSNHPGFMNKGWIIPDLIGFKNLDNSIHKFTIDASTLGGEPFGVSVDSVEYKGKGYILVKFAVSQDEVQYILVSDISLQEFRALVESK